MSEIDNPEFGGKHLKPVSHRDHQLVQYDPNSGAMADDETIDLRELWRSVVKRKWVVISVVLILLVSSFLATTLTVPVYKSTATIQIKPPGNQILQYQSFTNESGAAASCSSRCAGRTSTATLSCPRPRRAAPPGRWCRSRCKQRCPACRWKTRCRRWARWRPTGAAASSCRCWRSPAASARPPSRR